MRTHSAGARHCAVRSSGANGWIGFPRARVNEYVVEGPSGRYLVWEWFWVNGRVLTDPRRIKLYTAFDLMRGRGDESLAWFLWTRTDANPEGARSRLAQAATGLQEGARLARAW